MFRGLEGACRALWSPLRAFWAQLVIHNLKRFHRIVFSHIPIRRDASPLGGMPDWQNIGRWGSPFLGPLEGRKDPQARLIATSNGARIRRLLRILGEAGSWDQSYQCFSLDCKGNWPLQCPENQGDLGPSQSGRATGSAPTPAFCCLRG